MALLYIYIEGVEVCNFLSLSVMESVPIVAVMSVCLWGKTDIKISVLPSGVPKPILAKKSVRVGLFDSGRSRF